MKKNRHDKIIDIISGSVVETQEQLAERLRAEGYDVTQATVSRDIRELKLTKQVTEDGRQKYVYLSSSPNVMRDKYISVLKTGFVSMEAAQNILVIKTVSGMAMAVAAALDSLDFPQVVGCIAGDDTIMAAIRTSEEAIGLIDEINAMIK